MQEYECLHEDIMNFHSFGCARLSKSMIMAVSLFWKLKTPVT